MAGWRDLESDAPELAAFGVSRLTSGPAYLATVHADGRPRVHPVQPIIGEGHLFVFMEPTSPKARDLRERRSLALHSGVPDNEGSGGEYWVSGTGRLLDDSSMRAVRGDSSDLSSARGSLRSVRADAG